MMAEEAIGGWLDSVEQKKKLIKEKEKRCDDLEAENGSLQTKNAEQNKMLRENEIRIKELEESDESQKTEVIRLGKMNIELRKEKEKFMDEIGAEQAKTKQKE